MITNDDLPQPQPAVGQLLRDLLQINNRASALNLWGVRIGVSSMQRSPRLLHLPITVEISVITNPGNAPEGSW